MTCIVCDSQNHKCLVHVAAELRDFDVCQSCNRAIPVGSVCECRMDYKALYYDLLMSVGEKHPDETRHQTAKRYIIQAEQHRDSGCSQERKG